MGSCISWLTGRAAASRRPPNRDESGARVPIGGQPRSSSAASFLLLNRELDRSVTAKVEFHRDIVVTPCTL